MIKILNYKNNDFKIITLECFNCISTNSVRDFLNMLFRLTLKSANSMFCKIYKL